jgi:hypothetical protein
MRQKKLILKRWTHITLKYPPPFPKVLSEFIRGKNRNASQYSLGGMKMKILSASSKLVVGSALEGGFVYLKKGILTPNKVIRRGKL